MLNNRINLASPKYPRSPTGAVDGRPPFAMPRPAPPGTLPTASRRGYLALSPCPRTPAAVAGGSAPTGSSGAVLVCDSACPLIESVGWV